MSETSDESKIKWFINHTYPIDPNTCRCDRGCKCNSRIHSESSSQSLEGNSLNIEIEGTDGAKQNSPESHQCGSVKVNEILKMTIMLKATLLLAQCYTLPHSMIGIATCLFCFIFCHLSGQHVCKQNKNYILYTYRNVS